MTAVMILVKVTVAALLALAALKLAPRSRAALRHVVLASAFALLLMLPVASLVTPSIRVNVPVGSDSLPLPMAAAFENGGIDPATWQAPDESAGYSGDRAAAGADPFLTGAAVFGFLWLAGIAVFVFPMAVGLWQMRTLRRSGLPWRDGQSVVDRLASDAGIRRPVQVLLHESISGPMTCGAVRPAILLPPDARNWPVGELRSAIIHELAHVARFDWPTQCVARAIAAIYWFHPLVWMLRRQLILEAERACDDAVLRSSDATDYADQLVLLAERLSTGNQPALAMANRADLAARVVAVLDRRQARGRAGAATVSIVSGIAVAILAAIAPLRLVATAAHTEQLDSQAPAQRFETVSIRPCPDDTPPTGARSGARSGQGGFPNVSPGRFVIECGTVERMISNAYVLNGERLENNQARIGDVSWWKGGPGWLRTDKFTIEATAPGVSDRKLLLGPMLRALLEDRFKLRLHRETAEMPMYALTVARGGLKIQPIGPDGCETYDPDDARDPRERAAALVSGTAKPTCGTMHMTGGGPGGTARWIIGGTTLPDFAGTLSANMDRFVIDRTGVTDKFNIRLEFARDEHTPGADKRFGLRTDFPPSDGPNIFNALEQQLGLRLESIKGPQAFLVIDRVERPTPNGPAHVPSRAQGAGR